MVRIEYEQLGRDGNVQTLDRDLLNRGDGVTVLLYNLVRERSFCCGNRALSQPSAASIQARPLRHATV